MLTSLWKTKRVVGLLPFVVLLGGAHPPSGMPQQVLRIRVSQETSPGAGDFDKNVLGFIEPLQSDGGTADFYMYGNQGPNYGNSVPVLKPKTSQVFFVNGSDGIALFVVHNKSNQNDNNAGGNADVRYELSGGTASILKDDDQGEADRETNGGTVFHAAMDWAGSNTDGFVVGTLPVGFTLLGQFLKPPMGLDNGWVVISDDGTTIPLQLVPGQRARFDVHLGVAVQQDH